MSKPKTFGFNTLTLHAGQRPDPTTGARATPIYQTAAYVFKSPDHAASLFNVERAGHVYSRISNPTNADTRITVSGGGGANARIKDKYFSLRGMGADEDGDGYEEYKGQFTVHPGKISGRAPQRFSRLADPSNEFVGAQGSPAAFPTDPLNPAGAVVMTVIRPSDFGFGYLDPQELNMDIEGMAWAITSKGVQNTVSLDDIYLNIEQEHTRAEY